MPSPCLFNVAGAAKTDAVFHHDPPLFFSFFHLLATAWCWLMRQGLSFGGWFALRLGSADLLYAVYV